VPQRTHIMLHHSATKDSGTVSWGAIEKFHKETRGWRDIGYHAGVELVGESYYALIGRSIMEQAAACPEGMMNVRALHVCCVGDYDVVAPSSGLLEVLVERVLVPWMRGFGIPPENIVGHQDYNRGKSCPGRLFDLGVVRRMVR